VSISSFARLRPRSSPTIEVTTTDTSATRTTTSARRLATETLRITLPSALDHRSTRPGTITDTSGAASPGRWNSQSSTAPVPLHRAADAGAERIYLQVLDLGDLDHLDHLDMVASEVANALG